jgi:hypothetical protein
MKANVILNLTTGYRCFAKILGWGVEKKFSFGDDFKLNLK